MPSYESQPVEPPPNPGRTWRTEAEPFDGLRANGGVGTSAALPVRAELVEALRALPAHLPRRCNPRHKSPQLRHATLARDTLALRWWLLGFGDKVTVLAPKALREDFKKIAERMAGSYAD